MPDTSLWCHEHAYDYLDDLCLEGLAREFLRRNTDYQRDFRSGAPNLPAWGLRVAADPAASANQMAVHWVPALTSSDLFLSSLPIPSPSETVHIDTPPDVRSAHGAFGVIGTGASELRVSFLETSPADDASLCVVIPVDGDLPERIGALQRLWRLLHNKPAPDLRLSREKRRRLRQMVRASDGRTSGASTREIAWALFGRNRVGDEDWRSSSLRYTTLRLLRDCDELIGGGYRGLLQSGRAGARGRQLTAPCVRK